MMDDFVGMSYLFPTIDTSVMAAGEKTQSHVLKWEPSFFVLSINSLINVCVSHSYILVTTS